MCGKREAVGKALLYLNPLNNMYTFCSELPFDAERERHLQDMLTSIDKILCETFGTTQPGTREESAEMIIFAINACIVLLEASGAHEMYDIDDGLLKVPLAGLTNKIYNIYSIYQSKRFSVQEFKGVITAITREMTSLFCPEIVNYSAAIICQKTLTFVKRKVDFVTLTSINTGLDKLGFHRQKGL